MEWEKELKANFSKEVLKTSVKMSQCTTLRLGGKAQYFLEVHSEKELALALSIVNKANIPYYLLGKGSNVLVSDNELYGLVIHLGSQWSNISTPINLDKNTYQFTAQAGASLSKVANFAIAHSLSGMGFAHGIPGTVGGAVYMNAGAYGGEMKQVVTHVKAISATGEICNFSKEMLELGYRSSVFSKQSPQMCITEVTFTLSTGNKEELLEEINVLANKRKTSQPLNLPSCGSTFKRPTGYFAGTLIDECGLKGFRVGGCSVSVKHAGFLVNDQQGTATDYLLLIKEVQNRVEQEKGVLLQPEVKIWS